MKLQPRNVSVIRAICFQIAPDRGDHGLVVPCVLTRGLKGRMCDPATNLRQQQGHDIIR